MDLDRIKCTYRNENEWKPRVSSFKNLSIGEIDTFLQQPHRVTLIQAILLRLAHFADLNSISCTTVTTLIPRVSNSFVLSFASTNAFSAYFSILEWGSSFLSAVYSDLWNPVIDITPSAIDDICALLIQITASSVATLVSLWVVEAISNFSYDSVPNSSLYTVALKPWDVIQWVSKILRTS